MLCVCVSKHRSRTAKNSCYSTTYRVCYYVYYICSSCAASVQLYVQRLGSDMLCVRFHAQARKHRNAFASKRENYAAAGTRTFAGDFAKCECFAVTGSGHSADASSSACFQLTILHDRADMQITVVCARECVVRTPFDRMGAEPMQLLLPSRPQTPPSPKYRGCTDRDHVPTNARCGLLFCVRAVVSGFAPANSPGRVRYFIILDSIFGHCSATGDDDARCCMRILSTRALRICEKDGAQHVGQMHLASDRVRT